MTPDQNRAIEILREVAMRVDSCMGDCHGLQYAFPDDAMNGLEAEYVNLAPVLLELLKRAYPEANKMSLVTRA